MSRDTGGARGQTRSSALWGTGNRGGDSRANALWGKGGRGFAAFMLVLVATAVPLAGAGKGSNKPSSTPSYVDAYLTGMARTIRTRSSRRSFRAPRAWTKLKMLSSTAGWTSLKASRIRTSSSARSL